MTGRAWRFAGVGKPRNVADLIGNITTWADAGKATRTGLVAE